MYDRRGMVGPISPDLIMAYEEVVLRYGTLGIKAVAQPDIFTGRAVNQSYAEAMAWYREDRGDIESYVSTFPVKVL